MVICAGHQNLEEEQKDSNKEAITAFLTLPFEQFAALPLEARRRKAYSIALPLRAEWRTIDWTANEIDLANQLWQFRLGDGSRSYHLRLSSLMKKMMKAHHVEDERANKVKSIIEGRIQRQKKMVNDLRRSLRGMTDQEIKDVRIQKKALTARLRSERKLGRGFPLLTYIRSQCDPATKSPDELYRIALTYRDMYRSSFSFITSLRVMWRDLGIASERVIAQNNDRRNFEYPYRATCGNLDTTSMNAQAQSRRRGRRTGKDAGEYERGEINQPLPVMHNDLVAEGEPTDECDECQRISGQHFPLDETIPEGQKTETGGTSENMSNNLFFEAEDGDFLPTTYGTHHRTWDGDHVLFPDWDDLNL